jgi:hypothetical protein
MHATNQLIEATAKRRLGCESAVVYAYDVQDPIERVRVKWFGLSVQMHTGDEWEPIGRRRSREELLEMIEQRTCTLH